MSCIVLARHGQTAWNREEIFRGTMDIPLDEYGRIQARAMGKALRDLCLNNPLVVSSPLQRAGETAKIAGALVSNLPVTFEPSFVDMNFGRWQGQSKKEVAQLYPDLYKQWLKEPGSISFPGGESLADIEERALAALYALADKSRERDIIVVTHRVVTKVILGRLLDAGPGAFWKIKQDTACLNMLSYDGSSFVVGVMNDTCHLRRLELTVPLTSDY